MRRTQVIVSFPESRWSEKLRLKICTLAKNHGGQIGKSWTIEQMTPPFDRRRDDKAKRDAAVAELVAGYTYSELLRMKRAQEKKEWSGEEARRLRIAVQRYASRDDLRTHVKEHKVSLLDRHYGGEAVKDIASSEGVSGSSISYAMAQARRYLSSPKRRDHPVRKKHADRFQYDDEMYEYRAERAQQMRDTAASQLKPLHSTEELDEFQSMPDFRPLPLGEK